MPTNYAKKLDHFSQACFVSAACVVNLSAVTASATVWHVSFLERPFLQLQYICDSVVYSMRECFARPCWLEARLVNDCRYKCCIMDDLFSQGMLEKIYAGGRAKGWVPFGEVT